MRSNCASGDGRLHSGTLAATFHPCASRAALFDGSRCVKFRTRASRSAKRVVASNLLASPSEFEYMSLLKFLLAIVPQVRRLREAEALASAKLGDLLEEYQCILAECERLRDESVTMARRSADLEARNRELTHQVEELRWKTAPPGVAADQRAALPRVLGARLEKLRFLILGTCQVQHLAAAAPLFGHTADHRLYESRSHSEIPDVDSSKYDAIVVGFTLRHILYGADGRSMDVLHLRSDWTAERASEVLDKCVDILRGQVAAMQRAFKGVPAFFMSFLEPSFNYLGDLIVRGDVSNPAMFIRTLNDRLSLVLAEVPNFHYFDYNEIFQSIGTMHLRDDVMYQFTHASIIGDWDVPYDRERTVASTANTRVFDVLAQSDRLRREVYERLADNLKILRQLDSVKLIIVDLDDTLWRGIAAEDSVEAWERLEGWPLGLVEALLYFKKRGGLIAICSKNDHDATRERFGSIWTDRISIDDFASVKINWKSKAENVAVILQETNLLPESALFIDDNPREIDEVRSRFPDMRCLSGRHYDWRRIIMRSPETQAAYITEESRRRTELVRARIDREAESTNINRNDWLRSLKLEERFFVVRSADAPHYVRAVELLNKTNQFNTTGQRWTPAEIDDFIQRGGVLLVASLKDKTVDNGVVGVALVKSGAIVQAVLSCRVFGLGAELAMGSIATSIAAQATSNVKARIVDTGKNLSCHDYFEKIGFRKVGDYFETSEANPVPPWIKVHMDFEIGAIDCAK